MPLNKIPPGDNLPSDINVVVEIPAHSDPVKYEVDKKTGPVFVDRFMASAMHYPCNYGYIPGTLSDDGDPIDVLVPTPFPLIPGSAIRCRPIGVLNMTDESGHDAKILAVPADPLTPIYRHVEAPFDLPQWTLDQITHFFDHYKDLERGKWVKIEGWGRAEEAKAEIMRSIERYRDSPETLAF